MQQSFADSKSFQRILTQNVAIPVTLTFLLCLVFAGLLYSLLNAYSDSGKTDVMISRANESLRRIIDAETGARGFYNNGKENFLEPFVGAKARLSQDFEDLLGMSSQNPEQMRRMGRARDMYRTWLSQAEVQIGQKRQGTYKMGEGADEQKARMDSIRSEYRDFLSAAENTKRIKQEAASDQTVFLLVVTVIFALSTGLIMAYVGRKQVLTLSANYQKSLETQITQNQELTQQAWLRTGQAELAHKIRGDLTEKDLAERILNSIVEYVGSSVAALYVTRDGGQLERIGGFAFSEGSGGYGGTVRLGEGLVGQVAVSQKPLFLDSIPQNYIKISSGLGETAPKSLLVMPLTADGSVHGVMELGFADGIPERVKALLREVSEMSGLALRSAAYRARLQELLRRSQALTEELQTQQEELRVSNEELEERSKALMEAQTRLESQHAELEQTNEQLEEQAQVLEQQKYSLDSQNRELESAREVVEAKANELAAASKYKSEFLANMSHELRTPLNSSLILAKLLKDNPKGNLTSEQVEFADTIYSAGNDLLTLINDILDLSKVEAGHLEVYADDVPVPRLLDGLQKMFQPMADEKKLEFVVDKKNAAVETLFTDRLRLEQILKNLISNAIKFTATGQVKLSVEAGPEGLVRFRVKDTGMGIPAEQQQGIFEAFRQADGTTSRKYGGTGLGLSISRSLANLLGGEITVESAPGQGSTFTLVIPAQMPEQVASAPLSLPQNISVAANIVKAAKAKEQTRDPNAEPAPKAKAKSMGTVPDDREAVAPGRGKVLLIVEDEAVYARMLQEAAHDYDFQCLIADNTAEGYELATTFLPNAVILDMKLPDASGLTLLDRLKSNPKTRHIPVHVISAMDFTREALHLGAIGYISKPTEKSQLKETFRLLEDKIQQRIQRVLVVEDDAVQRSAIEKLIAEKSVEIISVGTGKEALEQLQGQPFDCIVMDLSLPDMSGFELLENMEHSPHTGFPPVIVYTGRSITRDEEDRLAKFSRSIIIKGARSPERLLDEVTLFLHQVEAQLSPEKREILSASRSREKAFEGRKILVVDDDVRNIFALTNALELKGAAVKAARNGREALEALAGESNIDLVLMDIMMPEMDGYEAMKKIRKQDRFKRLPIIAVTAKAMRDDYEKCLEAGANDYLPKPVDLDKLVSLMRVWLPKEIGRA